MAQHEVSSVEGAGRTLRLEGLLFFEVPVLLFLLLWLSRRLPGPWNVGDSVAYILPSLSFAGAPVISPPLQ